MAVQRRVSVESTTTRACSQCCSSELPPATLPRSSDMPKGHDWNAQNGLLLGARKSPERGTGRLRPSKEEGRGKAVFCPSSRPWRRKRVGGWTIRESRCYDSPNSSILLVARFLAILDMGREAVAGPLLRRCHSNSHLTQ